MYKIRNRTHHEFSEICQLYYQKYAIQLYSLILEFQIRLGEFVVYSWPTASDFDASDADDGNLTNRQTEKIFQ